MLTVLKILGIALLSVLALLLLAVALVLFVPVRYRAKASYDVTPLASVSVSWLLHAVSFRLDYEGALTYSLRVLGIDILGGLKKRGGKKERPEDTLNPEPKPEEDILREKPVEEAHGEPAREAYEARITYEEVTEAKEERLANPATELDEKEAGERKFYSSLLSQWEKVRRIQDRFREESPLQVIRSPILAFFRKVRDGWYKFRDFVTDRVRFIKVELWEKAMEKKDWLTEFLTSPDNRATFRLLKTQLVRLLSHLKPKELGGAVTFGFRDPYTTGQILTVISPFYPLYAEHFAVTPVFDEEVMEGQIKLRGRVRVFTVLWLTGRMFLDKNFRKLLNEFIHSD